MIKYAKNLDLLRTCVKHSGKKYRMIYTSSKLCQKESHMTSISSYEMPSSSTLSFADFITSAKTSILTPTVIKRSKNMILDTLGVAVAGCGEEISKKVLNYKLHYYGTLNILGQKNMCTIWGTNKQAPLEVAAFCNGVHVHSMDFDDTWYPPTHPSGAVLPSVMALSQVLQEKVTGTDLLMAFNIGIEVQGRLMDFSKEAKNIPSRFHPPTVVGTMGSAAACSRLMNLNGETTKHALAIAASFAGAPMANAGTLAKPLHMGIAAQHGLTAALLAREGVKGNPHILDVSNGFGVFYSDYYPKPLPPLEKHRLLLNDQNVAFKSFPAHLGMHWAAAAAEKVRQEICSLTSDFDIKKIEKIIIQAPNSSYVDRAMPTCSNGARHSFQFVTCCVLLDGKITKNSFDVSQMFRQEIDSLLSITEVKKSENNPPCFNSMYVEVTVILKDQKVFSASCQAPRGHWKFPLSQNSILNKFEENTLLNLGKENTQTCIDAVMNLENIDDCSEITQFLACS